MKGRTALLVVALALVTALVAFYAGRSTSTPQAGAGPAADRPGSSVDVPRTGGSGPSRSPAGSPKGSGDKASAPKKVGGQSGTTTQPGTTPAKPPTTRPQQQAGPVRFGKVTASGRGSETSVAPDRRALTTRFSDFEVTVDPESAEADATRTFTMTMPLTTGAAGETLRVYAHGFAFLDGGAKASVTLQGGGRQIIQGYGTGADDSFLQTLELPARPGISYQLTFAIDIDRGADAEGTGYLNVAAVDIEIR